MSSLAPQKTRGMGRAAQAAQVLIDLAEAAEPGDRLGTKEEVRQHCSVSKGTFNEALKLAQVRGAIVLRPGPGGGLFAAAPSPMVRLGNSMLALDTREADVRDAIRVRDALDPLLVDDAITHRTRHDLAAMRVAVATMRRAIDDGDSLAFVHANWLLHRAIADSSPTSVVSTIYVHMLEVVETHTLSVEPTDHSDASLEEFIRARLQLHAEIVDAIAARDRQLAAALMLQHATT